MSYDYLSSIHELGHCFTALAVGCTVQRVTLDSSPPETIWLPPADLSAQDGAIVTLGGAVASFLIAGTLEGGREEMAQAKQDADDYAGAWTAAANIIHEYRELIEGLAYFLIARRELDGIQFYEAVTGEPAPQSIIDRQRCVPLKA